MKILRIENKAAKVKLDDTVDEYSRKLLQQEIAKTYGSANAGNVAAFGEITNCVENAIDTLDIEINSPGGDVFDGFVIYNELLALRARGVHVTATINALAASMGSVIAMAADVVRIVPNGRMMIHEASGGMRGNANDMSRMAKVLDDISNEIAGIYAGKNGKTVEEMRALMMQETWLTAQAAIDLGLVDHFFDIRQTGNKIEAQTENSMIDYINRLSNPSAKESLERITALEASIASMETEHAAALVDRDAAIASRDTLIAEHVATIATANAALAEIPAIRAELVTAVATIAERDTAIAAHAAQLEAAESSAMAKAIAIAAAAGIELPIDVSDKVEKPNILAKLNALTGAERTKFYGENEQEIKSALLTK